MLFLLISCENPKPTLHGADTGGVADVVKEAEKK